MRPRGPKSMKKNQVVTNPENGQKIKVLGFAGFKGYRYHPTKGFRKESGFNPLLSSVIKL